MDSKRIIYPDEKLKELLQIPEGIELSLYNLNQYTGPHFKDIP
jgi:hypothetical protein